MKKEITYKVGDRVKIINKSRDDFGLTGKLKKCPLKCPLWTHHFRIKNASDCVLPYEIKLLKSPKRVKPKKEKPLATQDAFGSRLYYAVFTKLANDPEAMFLSQVQAELYCKKQLLINTRSKFTIQVIDNLVFKYVQKFCKSCGQEVDIC